MGQLVCDVCGGKIIVQAGGSYGVCENCGATLTDDLLSVRFLSHDNLICQRVMRDIWQSLRPLLTSKTACSPRIWQT